MTFSILITTKNRLKDLEYTLLKSKDLIARIDVEVIICDDGSTDGTYDYLQTKFPELNVIKNKKSKGLIYSRNRLLALTNAKYAITLDDDANFLSSNPLENIENFLENNKKCGVIAFRIFWGTDKPKSLHHNTQPQKVKGFVGCGHVWRMTAWKAIPDYPDWFIFYGEEEYASLELFKTNWDIWYNPEIVVHHRVNVKGRKKDKDYITRLKRSLRAGWYLCFLFYPLIEIPKRLSYSIWMQLKLKVFKGDLKVLLALIGALGSVIYNTPKLISTRNALSKREWSKFNTLSETKIYWKPKEEKS